MTKRIEFKPSQEAKDIVGESIEPGQRFELMTTFQAKEDGDWCIVSIEGAPQAGYNADATLKEDEKYPEKSEFAARYKQEMGAA